MDINKEEIISAKEGFGDFIHTTSLSRSSRLSRKYNADIYLKKENEHEIRSYKIRGAFHLINGLSEREKGAGVVCASAGNHAQGVAYTCNHLKIKGTIYMPITTPKQKIYKTKQFGGKYIKVELFGDTFDEAYEGSKKFEKDTGATFVHPFDDPRIITGQATVGKEIFDILEPDLIICPVGGGGLSAGIISATKAFEMKTKIIGVEPEGAASMKLSLEKGENTALDKINTFVDGASVKKVGDIPFEIAKEYNLPILTCPEERVCSTLLEYSNEDGLLVEPAGALSTDVLKDMKDEVRGKVAVLIISGSNFDHARFQEVKENSIKWEGLKKYFSVSFPQRPGALKDFLEGLVGKDDITYFNYRKTTSRTKGAASIGIETDKKENWKRIMKHMQKHGLDPKDITDNEHYLNLLNI